MSPRHGLRQRIVIVDPVAGSREHLRRAVRALGHTPLVFESLEELQAVGTRPPRCVLMCLGLPAKSKDAALWIQMAKQILGRQIPALLLTRDRVTRTARLQGVDVVDELLVAPSVFPAFCKSMAEFMMRHGLPTAGRGLTLGDYCLDPSSGSVLVDGVEIPLNPVEFELALEFLDGGAHAAPETAPAHAMTHR